MRRKVMKSWPVAVVVVAFLAFTPTASAVQSQTWRGKTAQDLPLRFKVVTTPSGERVIREFDIIYVLRCFATRDRISVGVGFFGFDVPIHNGRFRFKETDLDLSILFAGALSAGKASGRTSFSFPAFVPPTLGLQVCTSGRVRWSAQRVTTGTRPATVNIDYRIRVTDDGAGGMDASITQAYREAA